MFVKVEQDYDAMSLRGAQVVAEVVRQKPNAVLGLATGSTPEGLYRCLIRIAKEENIDFSQVTTFNLDEYEGLPAGHPQSYHAFMWKHLFEGLGLREEQTNLLSGIASDLARQKLNRHRAFKPGVLGFVDGAHATFTEFFENLVVEYSFADHSL